MIKYPHIDWKNKLETVAAAIGMLNTIKYRG